MKLKIILGQNYKYKPGIIYLIIPIIIVLFIFFVNLSTIIIIILVMFINFLLVFFTICSLGYH